MTNLRAIGLAVAAFTMWVFADTAIKLAGESALPPLEIVAFQGLLTTLFLVGYRASRRDIRSLLPLRWKAQVLRAFLDLGNVLGVVVALRHLPLTVFYIIVFSAPMLIAILSYLFLGEKLHRRNLLAIATGFAGVVIAVRPLSPHQGGDWIGYAACAICVLCFSGSIVWLRTMTQTERLDSLMVVSSSLMTIAGFGAMLWRAEPLTPRLAVLLPVIGITVGLGNYFSFKALRSIPAAIVSQYHYTQLVSGAFIAWLIWHETPSMAMLAGAILIVGSGLTIAAYERRVARSASKGELLA